jgi:hypothetical protein
LLSHEHGDLMFWSGKEDKVLIATLGWQAGSVLVEIELIGIKICVDTRYGS